MGCSERGLGLTRPGSHCDLGLTRPGSHCDLGFTRPGSRCGLGRLELVSPFLLLLLLSLSLSFFFSFFSCFCCFYILGLLSMNVCNYYFWVRNQVLETQFSGRRHVEKIPHQTLSTHENQVPKIRFIGPKSSLLDSRC